MTRHISIPIWVLVGLIAALGIILISTICYVVVLFTGSIKLVESFTPVLLLEIFFACYAFVSITVIIKKVIF